MSTLLTPGAAPRKKLDQVRAQRIEVEQELGELEDDSEPLTVAEAVDRAMAHWRIQVERARYDLSVFRQRASSPPETTLCFHDALIDEKEMRVRLVAMFKADGKGDGLAAADQHARIRTLKAKLSELMMLEYCQTFELLDQGYAIEGIVQLPPDLLLRAVRDGAQ
jgi:hypothetical protein